MSPEEHIAQKAEEYGSCRVCQEVLNWSSDQPHHCAFCSSMKLLLCVGGLETSAKCKGCEEYPKEKELFQCPSCLRVTIKYGP